MEDFNLNSIDFVNNRFKIYKELRDNHPCWWSEINQCWMISRYNDVTKGLSDYKTFSTKYGITLETRKPIDSNRSNILFGENDPPEHLKDKKILKNIINEANLNQLIIDIKKYLNNRIKIDRDIFIFKDIASDYPYEALFSLINIQKDQELLIKQQSELLFNKSTLEEQSDSIITIAKSLLYNPPSFKKEENFTDYERMYYASIILMSGAKTVSGSILNLVNDIYKNKDQYCQVLNNKKWIPNFVEESLRLNDTSQYIVRTALKDIFIHNKKICTGDSVVFITGAAQTDGPNDLSIFNIHRNFKNSNLAFGHGPHRCPGISLARFQLQEFLKYIINNNLFIDIKNIEYKDKADFSTSIIKEIDGVFINYEI
jgi:hypothetical protein